MPFETILNVIITSVILLLVLSTFIVLNLKKLAITIEKAEYELYFQLTAKADLIPLYIEILSKYYDRNSFKDLIEKRSKTLQEKTFGNQKMLLEKDLWQLFEDIRKTSLNNEKVKGDLELKSLENKFTQANHETETARDIYNKLVKKYNQWTGFFVIKPLCGISKMPHKELY